MLKFKLDKDGVEPVYRQLRRQIVAKIDTGELPPGARVPAVREISRATGVSCGTVGKAIAELTRESYLSGRGRKGLVVAARDNFAVGIVGKFKERTLFHDRYYQAIMGGVETILHARNCALTFRTAGDRIEGTFDGFRVDGVLALGVGIMEANRPALIRWSKQIPLMAIGAWGTPSSELSYVISDNAGDSRRAVETLARAGRAKIAGYFHYNKSARLDGYRQALAAAGLTYDERLVTFRDDGRDVDECLTRVAALRPDAIFDSVGDLWPRLLERIPPGTPPPAVATYRDYPPEWERLNVPHVIVRQPLRAMGATAAERLTGMIERRERHVIQVVLQSEIVDCL